MNTINLKQIESSEAAVTDNTTNFQRSISYIVILSLMVFMFILSGCSDSDDSSSNSIEDLTISSLSSGTPMAMSFNGPVQDDDTFTIVVLPDTQYYCQDYPETFYAQADWIVQNAASKNIKFVIHLGDIVNSSTSAQWEIADTAFKILDNNDIPYSVALGNHDYETVSDFNRDSTKFNEHFGVSRFRGKPWYGGGYPSGKNDNSYYVFEAGDLDFLVISLEFAPQKDILSWAADIINSYPDHRVIIITHGYLWTDTYSPQHANITTYYDLIGSDGTTLFNEFISRYSNIFLVVAGHYAGDSVRSITANDGHTIYEMLVDYQLESYGGNGWFKTLEFSPSNNTIISTPYNALDISTTFSLTSFYSSMPIDHTYELSYDMSTVSDFSEDIDPVGFNDRTINSTGSGNQASPKVASNSSGYSVAVWEDDSDDDGNFNIKIRGFTPDGIEKFGEATVNNNTNGTHLNPSIAVNASGNVVVVWQDDSDGNGYYDIKMSGYTIDGTCLFSNYTVNSDSYGQQVNPSVAMDLTGKFVVVWQDYDNIDHEIHMKGFDSTGSEYFSRRTANSTSTGRQLNPDVDILSNDNFVVVWENDNGGNGYNRIYMRGFNLSASTPEYFSEREVDPDGDGQQFDPVICKLADGNFVVAWEDDNDVNGYHEIYISGFDSEGSQYFIQKAASSSSEGQEYNPAIASDEDGYFAVTWQDGFDDDYDIMTRAFNQSAVQIMEQLRVNKDTSGQQTAPDVTIGNEGRMVIIWTDDTDSDGYDEILGRGAYDFGFELYYGD